MRSFGMGVVNESCGDPDAKKWLFHFGAYGDTHVLVVGVRSLEKALESAADWLADHAPGQIMKHDDPELLVLLNEAKAALREEGEASECCASLDRVHWCDACERFEEQAQDRATSDLTYTESGYVTSYEWTVTEDPDREHILDLQKRGPEETRGTWCRLSAAYGPIAEYTPAMIGRVHRVRDCDRRVTVRLLGGKFAHAPRYHVWPLSKELAQDFANNQQ